VNDAMRGLQRGNLHDPFQVLGFQKNRAGKDVIRAFFPTAELKALICLKLRSTLTLSVNTMR